MKKSLGCFTRGLVALALLAVIGIVAASMLGGDGGSDTGGEFKGIVTIADPAAWVAQGEGCVGTGALDYIEGGASVVTADLKSSENESESALTNGVPFADGSCQFAFGGDAFTADTYLIAVGGTLARCDVSDIGVSGDDRIVEVLATADGLTCRPLGD